MLKFTHRTSRKWEGWQGRKGLHTCSEGREEEDDDEEEEEEEDEEERGNGRRHFGEQRA
jgi:hypothetical protein